MKSISTEKAPKAIGPSSQAVRAGDFVFLSGQIPLDPQTGALVKATIEIETQRVFENLRAVLAAAGCTFANVVRTTIYLTDMNDFAAVNAEYGKAFEGAETLPARATVEVKGLPKGARVEIDAVAFVSKS
jgi:2-iminobutanoate/2-iminopropanoate deaminase